MEATEEQESPLEAEDLLLEEEPSEEEPSEEEPPEEEAVPVNEEVTGEVVGAMLRAFHQAGAELFVAGKITSADILVIGETVHTRLIDALCATEETQEGRERIRQVAARSFTLSMGDPFTMTDL